MTVVDVAIVIAIGVILGLSVVIILIAVCLCTPVTKRLNKGHTAVANVELPAPVLLQVTNVSLLVRNHTLKHELGTKERYFGSKYNDRIILTEGVYEVLTFNGTSSTVQWYFVKSGPVGYCIPSECTSSESIKVSLRSTHDDLLPELIITVQHNSPRQKVNHEYTLPPNSILSLDKFGSYVVTLQAKLKYMDKVFLGPETRYYYKVLEPIDEVPIIMPPSGARLSKKQRIELLLPTHLCSNDYKIMYSTLTLDSESALQQIPTPSIEYREPFEVLMSQGAIKCVVFAAILRLCDSKQGGINTAFFSAVKLSSKFNCEEVFPLTDLQMNAKSIRSADMILGTARKSSSTLTNLPENEEFESLKPLLSVHCADVKLHLSYPDSQAAIHYAINGNVFRYHSAFAINGTATIHAFVENSNSSAHLTVSDNLLSVRKLCSTDDSLCCKVSCSSATLVLSLPALKSFMNMPEPQIYYRIDHGHTADTGSVDTATGLIYVKPIVLSSPDYFCIRARAYIRNPVTDQVLCSSELIHRFDVLQGV